jgi:hypothetical protein
LYRPFFRKQTSRWVNNVARYGEPRCVGKFYARSEALLLSFKFYLSFRQAAGQQQKFTGDTTEQWKVFFGSGSFAVNCNSNPCTTSTSGSMQEFDTLLMNTPSGGVSPWNLVSMTFVADATSDVLSFLAWGDNGNTTNLPPTVFLAGVNSPALPEPPTLALFGIAFVGLAASRWGKRAKSGSAG